jgi:hypothetical protein
MTLASLSFDINPANAASVSQGTNSSISVMEKSSSASPQEFSLGVASTGSLGSGEMDRVSHSGHSHNDQKGRTKNKSNKGGQGGKKRG